MNELSQEWKFSGIMYTTLCMSIAHVDDGTGCMLIMGHTVEMMCTVLLTFSILNQELGASTAEEASTTDKQAPKTSQGTLYTCTCTCS